MPQGSRGSGRSQVRRTLFEDRTEGRLLRGWVTGDGAAAGLDCQLFAKGWPEAGAERLGALLGRHRVVHGVDRPALEAIAAEAREGRSVIGRVVARGTPPEPGRDGVLEFIVRPSSEGARYQKDEKSGRIDYRETNLVENVLKDEPVAIALSPRAGEPGRNVFGEPVAPPEGKPAKFRAGEGTRFEEESRQVIATRDGRVVWESGVVSVSANYHVRGSVDYSVGNIAFVGDVTIDSDVLDGFNVRAGGNLTVGGNVGACKVDSERNLVVKGGVFGKGKAQLRAKGRLTARFLNDCRAESAGTMSVEREALGSMLLTNGCLLMPAGRLVGGAVSALRGADVAVVGSAMGVSTSISAGTDYNLARRLAEMESRISRLDASAQKVSSFLGPLLGDRRRMSHMLSRRRGDMEKLVGVLRSLRAERAEMAKALESLAEESHRGAVHQINVRKLMHPGTLLEINSVRHRFKSEARGPITIVPEKGQGSLRTTEFRTLPVPEASEKPASGDK